MPEPRGVPALESVPAATREDLRPVAEIAKLAGLLLGLLVALGDLLAEIVEGRPRPRPSRIWLLRSLRHAMHLSSLH